MVFFVVFQRCAHIWRSRLVLQSVVVPSSWGIILFDSGDSGVSCLSLPTPAPLCLLPPVGEFLSFSVLSVILKEISPEDSLERLMLKLKLPYSGRLMRRTDSLEKTLWLHGDCSHEIKRRLLLGRKAMTNLDSILKSRDITLRKSPYSQSCGFSSGHVWMWELGHKESWAPKNWCFWTVVLEKTLESPLDC